MTVSELVEKLLDFDGVTDYQDYTNEFVVTFNLEAD